MGKSKTTTSNKVDPWMPSADQWSTLTSRANEMMTPQFQQAMQGAQGYLGQASASPVTGPGVQHTLMGAMRPGGNMDNVFNAATRQAQTPQFAPGYQATMRSAMDPAARSAAFDQVKQNAIADIMPALNSTFAGSGMTGSSLHQQNLAKGLSAGIAGVENQAYQAGMDRALGAAQSSQSALQQQQNNALSAAGARQDALTSGQGQALQAAGMQNQIAGQEFSRNMALSNAQLGLGNAYQGAYSGNLANMMSAATGGAARSSTQSQSPGLMGILGAGLQVASLFSDRSLKTDVKRVGSLDDGTPIYTYRYASGGPVHMGVMADELERSHPGAVSTGVDGLKRVNYGAI